MPQMKVEASKGNESLGTPPAHGHPQVPLLSQPLRCLLSAAGELGSLEQKKDKTQGPTVRRSTLRADRDRGTSHLMPRARKAQRVGGGIGLPGKTQDISSLWIQVNKE